MSEQEQIDAYKCDRSEWGRGPWDDEPDDRVEWRSEGLACLMVRNYSGAWCGYVGVPPGHPWHGVNYNDVDAIVHGGLTYSDRCAGHICHVPSEGEPHDVWWLGFDCFHSGDKPPLGRPWFPGGTYRDARYVRSEVNGLARQAREEG